MMKVVMTFLESYNFKGKTIVPFCTHGGYRTSGTGKMAFFLSRWFLCVVMFFMQVHST